MGANETCKHLCTLPYSTEEQKPFTKLVDGGYKVHLVLDNLPAVLQRQDGTSGRIGAPIGYKDTDNNTCLYNHLRFTIEYNIANDKEKRKNVVGFKVHPFSVHHKVNAGDSNSNELTTCPVMAKTSPPMCFNSKRTQSQSVVWTYDIEFKLSHVAWANRWESLLNPRKEMKKFYRFSLTNSLWMLLFLTAALAHILFKALHLDFEPTPTIITTILCVILGFGFRLPNNNNGDDDAGLVQGISGWKAIHGDVFIPPRGSGILCVLVGSGAQVLCMFAATLALALIGVVSPANSGSIITAILSLWVLASAVGGYCAARVYSTLHGNGTKSKAVVAGSAFLFPGIAFFVFFGINLLLWMNESPGAVPLSTLGLLLFMWVGVSAPLNVLGAGFAYKQPAYEYPVRTNRIPRAFPAASRQSATLLSQLSAKLWSGLELLGKVFLGFAMFRIVLMSFLGILSSISNGRFFKNWGFLGAQSAMLVVTCAQVSILTTYMKLSQEYHHWWWSSFLNTASIGAYAFACCIISEFSQNNISNPGDHTVSRLVWVGYSAIGSLAFALAAGCIGFLASFVFVRKSYAVLAWHDNHGTRTDVGEIQPEPVGRNQGDLSTPRNRRQYGAF